MDPDINTSLWRGDDKSKEPNKSKGTRHAQKDVLDLLRNRKTYLVGRFGSGESFSLCLQSYAVGLEEDMSF